MDKYIYSCKLILVTILAVPLNAVTVNPTLCPTNKIAPHRRIANLDYGYQARTLGAFYDLLAPGGANQQFLPLNGLQEEPQKDDPDDCGDIEDYDENDLSSITPQNYNRRGYATGRLFFGQLFDNVNGQGPQNPQPGYPGRPPNNPGYPARPPNNPGYPVRPQNPQGINNVPFRPQRPQSQYPAVRPPYWSGGPFGNNPYRPPSQQYPSDDIKPVHDIVQEPQTTYRPSIVGGPSGAIIGAIPATTLPPAIDDPRTQNYQNRPQTSTRSPVRFPTQSTTEAPLAYPTRRPRTRNSDSVLGSFFDLLF